MNLSGEQWGQIALATVIFAVLLFLTMDCGGGKTCTQGCRIVDKYRKEAWDEHTTQTISSYQTIQGRRRKVYVVVPKVIHHPEEFYITVSSADGTDTRSVFESRWRLINPPAIMSETYTLGRYSKIKYNKHLNFQ